MIQKKTLQNLGFDFKVTATFGGCDFDCTMLVLPPTSYVYIYYNSTNGQTCIVRNKSFLGKKSQFNALLLPFPVTTLAELKSLIKLLKPKQNV